MATQSRKESKLYLRSKEGTAGTQDDYDFCEAKSVIMTKPNPVFLHEMDRGKLGAGEHGRLAEVQAVYTPFSLKCSRLTEWLYFMSYFQGQTDTVETVDTGVYKHELEHLPVTSRTLPTFSATYYDGNGAQVMTHCIINEFSTTFGSGGNGIVDATFSGFCNLHYDSSGTITINADTNAFSSGTNDTAIASEPLLNFKGCKVWMGTAAEATPLVQSNITMTAADISSSEEITQFINSITLTGNNGIDGEGLLRAGGGGVLNNQERGDRSYTLAINLRMDDTTPTSTFRARVLAETQCAIELQCLGGVIGATAYRYGIDCIWPVVQFLGEDEDDGGPINQELKAEVFQDSEDMAFYCYGQNAISSELNSTL